MSAHLCIEVQYLSLAGQIFLKFYSGGVSLSFVKNVQVWLKLDKGNMYFMYVYDYCGHGDRHGYLC